MKHQKNICKIDKIRSVAWILKRHWLHFCSCKVFIENYLSRRRLWSCETFVRPCTDMKYNLMQQHATSTPPFLPYSPCPPLLVGSIRPLDQRASPSAWSEGIRTAKQRKKASTILMLAIHCICMRVLVHGQGKLRPFQKRHCPGAWGR